MEKKDVEDALHVKKRKREGEEGEEGEKTVFLCGPVGFMEVTSKWLAELGVKGDQIKQEAFNF